LREIEAQEHQQPAPTASQSLADEDAKLRALEPKVGSGKAPIPQGLADEDAKRRALEPKVWSGKASVDEIRLLKALCSHLGNRECRDRASAQLKKKLEHAPS